MTRLGSKAFVYHGEVCLGEVNAIPMKDVNFQFPANVIRIHHILPKSERCHPLSVLQTISSSLLCKLQPISSSVDHQLMNLHSSCFTECKTAVIYIGDEEVHLVAMRSKQQLFPCFWCYSVRRGLYEACSRMLNLRSLSIVFDLDETLVVSNTLKSFEYKIGFLKGSIKREKDPIKISRILAEMQRYREDRALLNQYMENNSVVDDGKVYKVQPEEATPLGNGHVQVIRPVIRIPEKNIMLTRINPKIRDTSVLVRLRHGWEDMRNYLIAKGRRRFEVYVCTKTERDYAMEIWRLLDPEAQLIKKIQLEERLVCVKSGAKKCLQDVFKDGSCDPNLAMVIDDRLDVWKQNDHSRVHVIPAFTPYSAPQAEIIGVFPVPVLRVARNVACNFRLEFFRDFDKNPSRKVSLVVYEDEAVNLPSAPNVSIYINSQDISFAPNENVKPPCAEGTNGLKEVSLPNIIGATSIRVETPSKINPEPISFGAPLEQNVNLLEVDPYMNRGFRSSIDEDICFAPNENVKPPCAQDTNGPIQDSLPNVIGAVSIRSSETPSINQLNLRPILLEQDVNLSKVDPNRNRGSRSSIDELQESIKIDERRNTTSLYPSKQLPVMSTQFSLLPPLLKENKLNGSNYIEWKKNLDWILSNTEYGFVFTHPFPEYGDGFNITQSQLVAQEKWRKANRMVRFYMLASMSYVLQTQHNGIETAKEILDSLSTIFTTKESMSQVQSSLEDIHSMKEEFSLQENDTKMGEDLAFLEHVRYMTRIEETAIQNATKMEEGVSVGEHVVKMVNNFTFARVQRDRRELASQISIILESLPDSYSQFKFDHVKNLDEFMEKLQMAEIIIKSKNEAGLSFRPLGHGHNKRKGTFLDCRQNSKKQKKKALFKKNQRNFNDVTKDKCFICGEKGHFKQHCPKVDLNLGYACASCN